MLVAAEPAAGHAQAGDTGLGILNDVYKSWPLPLQTRFEAIYTRYHMVDQLPSRVASGSSVLSLTEVQKL